MKIGLNVAGATFYLTQSAAPHPAALRAAAFSPFHGEKGASSMGCVVKTPMLGNAAFRSEGLASEGKP
jgi:hypothetical protein